MEHRAAAIKTEKAFSDLWERSLDLRPRVVGTDDEPYEILFPGVRNQGAGPDFRGAVLRHNGRTVGGDVELHLDSRGWRAHGHHRDPNYRGVVLQVVLKTRGHRDDPQVPPTAEARFAASDGDGPGGSAPRRRPDLEHLGFGRFLAKSAGYRLAMESTQGPDQVVYAALLDAMGYAHNRRPFRTLAGRVRYAGFSRLAGEPAAAARFAILSTLVVGGNLLDDVDHHERLQMRRVSRQLRGGRRLARDEWSGFRVRPNNVPAKRIRGIAPLLARHLRTGLLRGLEVTFDREGTPGLIGEVEHRPFIGAGLALTVAANVALPVLHASAMLEGLGGEVRLESAFREMRAPPSDSVTRGVSAALGLNQRPRLASEHFGLHVLARMKAWPGETPVSRPDRQSSAPPRGCGTSP